MIIDREIVKYFKDLKKYIEENKNINSETIYEKLKFNMNLLGFIEVSFNNTSTKNIDIYTIKFHKFNKSFKENCIEYVINITLFDNCNTNELLLNVNYSEIKTTQKTLF